MNALLQIKKKTNAEREVEMEMKKKKINILIDVIDALLPFIATFVFAVLLIYNGAELHHKRELVSNHTDKAIAQIVRQGTHHEDKIDKFNNVYDDITHSYTFGYEYKDEYYEFTLDDKNNKDELPSCVTNIILNNDEKLVLLINPDNPEEKVFAEKTKVIGNYLGAIIGAIIWAVALMRDAVQS